MGHFAPDSQPGPYLEPTEGITAPPDTELYAVGLHALPSIDLNNQSIKKMLFQQLENCKDGSILKGSLGKLMIMKTSRYH